TTPITTVDDPSGIALSVWKLDAPDRKTTDHETAWLLLSGTLELAAGGEKVKLSRRSLFDEPPCAFHVSVGTEVRCTPSGPCELLALETKNTARFAPTGYLQVKDE